MKFKLFAFLLSTITFLTCIIAFNMLSSTGSVQPRNHGYINQAGTLVIQPQFSEAFPFSEGLAAVATEGHSDGANADGNFTDKWGYINKQGQLVIKPIFSNAGSFSEGLATVEIGRTHNNIDKNGTPVGDITGKWGYIDKTGKQVIPLQFELANSFSEGLAAVYLKGKCGYINKSGKVVIQPHFSSCEYFSEELAVVETVAR